MNPVPPNYDEIYLHYAREGARVLCLGYKELGPLSHQQIRDMPREECEKGLTFAGFVIISCPFKPDTKSVIKEILNSSHHITMITGDNPLTACHVAAQLKLIDKKNTFVLTKRNQSGDASSRTSWFWQSIVDESVEKPMEFAAEKSGKTKTAMNKVQEAIMMSGSNFLCLTGDVIQIIYANLC